MAQETDPAISAEASPQNQSAGPNLPILPTWSGQSLRLLTATLVGVGITFVILQSLNSSGSDRPGTTYGNIYVDTPEVYTRERLVNDRFQQDAWLRSKLNTQNLVFGPQGSRATDTSSKTSVAAGMGVGTAQKSGEKVSQPQPKATGSEQPPSMASPIDAFRDELAYREEIRNEIIENQLDDRHDIAGNTLYRFKFDATLIPQHDTSAYAIIEVSISGPVNKSSNDKPPGKTAKAGEDSSTDKEADKSEETTPISRAPKDKPAGEMAKDFEDSSTDKEAEEFDEAIKRTFQSISAVEKRLKFGSIAMLSSLYDNWLTQLEDDLNQRVRDIQKLLKQPGGQASDVARNLRSYARENYIEYYWDEYQTCRSGSVDEKEAEGKERCLNKWLEEGRSEDRDFIASYVEYDLPRRLPNISRYANFSNYEGVIERSGVSKDETFYVLDEEDDRYLYSQKKADSWMKTFENTLKQLRQKPYFALFLFVDKEADETFISIKTGRAAFLADLTKTGGDVYIYAVTPKESVQRISDTSRRSQEVEFSLGAHAANADAAVGHAQGRNAQIQAIMRQPLVVGFHPNPILSTDRDAAAAAMGWLIGPRFSIPSDPRADVSFRHVPAQQALTAIVSAPSWWQEIEVRAEAYWLTETGEAKGRKEIMKTRVKLPGDPGSISDIILPGSGIKKPEIAEEVEKTHLTVCRPGSVLIPGNHLWRSAVVMLGAQRADAINVLPSMDGIVATFNEVQPPGNWSQSEAKEGKLPLTVWTSEGKATLPVDKLQIHERGARCKNQDTATAVPSS